MENQEQEKKPSAGGGIVALISLVIIGYALYVLATI